MTQCQKTDRDGWMCTRVAGHHDAAHVAGTDETFDPDTIRAVWVELPIAPGSSTWVDAITQAREEREAAGLII